MLYVEMARQPFFSKYLDFWTLLPQIDPSGRFSLFFLILFFFGGGGGIAHQGTPELFG